MAIKPQGHRARHRALSIAPLLSPAAPPPAGILNVSAEDRTTGKKNTITITNDKGRLRWAGSNWSGAQALVNECRLLCSRLLCSSHRCGAHSLRPFPA